MNKQFKRQRRAATILAIIIIAAMLLSMLAPIVLRAEGTMLDGSVTGTVKFIQISE